MILAVKSFWLQMFFFQTPDILASALDLPCDRQGYHHMRYRGRVTQFLSSYRKDNKEQETPKPVMCPGWVWWETQFIPSYGPPYSFCSVIQSPYSFLKYTNIHTLELLPFLQILYKVYSSLHWDPRSDICWPNWTSFHSILPLLYFSLYHAALSGCVNADIHILIFLPWLPN